MFTVTNPPSKGRKQKNPNFRQKSKMGRFHKTLISAFVLFLVILPLLVSAAEEENECGGGSSGGGGSAAEKATALKCKIVAFFSILIAGVLGVCLPIFGLKSESNLFMFVKAFAAGVILATGFVHILPDATESLTSPCIGEETPWGDFPMTGFVAMCGAILTMLIESFASGYLNRSRSEKESKTLPVSTGGDKEEHSHSDSVHTHASQGHSHGSLLVPQDHDHVDLRKKIVTQVTKTHKNPNFSIEFKEILGFEQNPFAKIQSFLHNLNKFSIFRQTHLLN